MIIVDLRSFFPIATDVELPENIQADIQAAEDAEPDCLTCPNRDSEDSLACCKLYGVRRCEV